MIARAAALAALLLAAGSVPREAGAADLAISADGRHFTIDGERRFLVQASYYGALTITDPVALRADLDDLSAAGFNSIRVFVHWQDEATRENASALSVTGDAREPWMSRLQQVLAEAQARGLVVDLSLRREAGSSLWPIDLATHLRAVQTLAAAVRPWRNAYFDLANERNVADARFVSLDEVGVLAEAVRAIDPGRLMTASSVPASVADLDQHFRIGKLDFLAPHLCRGPSCPAGTRGNVEMFAAWMDSLGRRRPIHLQEPFRRGWSAAFEPVAEDFFRDATGARAGDAAGWCFHNGPQMGGRPYRSFSMNPAQGRLFAQLDAVERDVVLRLVDELGGTRPERVRMQAEYSEQVAASTGQKNGLLWSVVPGRDAPGWLVRGPAYARLPAGRYEARFRMRIDDRIADRAAVLGLEVVDLDAPAPGRLASRQVERDDFVTALGWQSFVLPFASPGAGHRLELRADWLGQGAIDLDHVEFVPRRGRAAPRRRTCLDELPGERSRTLRQASLVSPAAVADITAERHAHAEALGTAATWDFRPASGRDTFVQIAPVDPDWSCSVSGACAGFRAPRAGWLETVDRPDSGERDAWAFGVDGTGSIRIGGVAVEEGLAGEARTCFGPGATWTAFGGAGSCLEPGDGWSSTLLCNAGVTRDDPCGVGLPPAVSIGASGTLSGRALGRGVLTLPSGHALDAMLVEHRVEVELGTPLGSCDVPIGAMRQTILEWLVPALGAAVQMRGPDFASDDTWTVAEDAVVSHGLLPPLSLSLEGEGTDWLQVAWDPGHDPRHIDEYVVHWGLWPGAPDRSSEEVGDVLGRAATSYTITGLTPGTTYHVSVSARSRYTDPVSQVATIYRSVELPRSIGSDADDDGIRETSYPPELEARTRDGAVPLLRGSLARLGDPRAPVLPLERVRDLYLDRFHVALEDPDVFVLSDTGRPLVFYALGSDARMYAAKAPAGRLRLSL